MTAQDRTAKLTGMYVNRCATGDRKGARRIVKLLTLANGSVFAKDIRQAKGL